MNIIENKYIFWYYIVIKYDKGVIIMKCQIIGRGVSITKAMENRINDKLSGLDKYIVVSNGEVDCRVVVNNLKMGQKLEITITSKYVTLRAEVEDLDLYNAIDTAYEKLEDQIRRAKTKMSRKGKESFSRAIAFDAVDAVEEDGKDVLVRTKSIKVEEMDIDSAIAQMTLLGHDFYIYKDDETEEVAVVYKRKQGGYGLIEVEK